MQQQQIPQALQAFVSHLEAECRENPSQGLALLQKECGIPNPVIAGIKKLTMFKVWDDTRSILLRPIVDHYDDSTHILVTAFRGLESCEGLIVDTELTLNVKDLSFRIRVLQQGTGHLMRSVSYHMFTGLAKEQLQIHFRGLILFGRATGAPLTLFHLFSDKYIQNSMLGMNYEAYNEFNVITEQTRFESSPVEGLESEMTVMIKNFISAITARLFFDRNSTALQEKLASMGKAEKAGVLAPQFDNVLLDNPQQQQQQDFF